MLQITTPIDRLFRMTLEIDATLTDLQEGEWVSPSTANGNLFVRTGSAGAAPNIAFQCWLDQKRPDSQASGLVGSGTIATPFGKYVGLTDMLDPGSTYAVGDKLAVKVVSGKAVVTKAGDTDVVHAICLVPPTNPAAAGARIKFAVL